MNGKIIAAELSKNYNGAKFESEVLDDGSVFVSTNLKDDLIIKPFMLGIIAEEMGLTYLSITFDITKKKLKSKHYKLLSDYNNLVKTLKMFVNTIDGESYLEVAFFSFRSFTTDADVLNDVDYFLETIFEGESESLNVLNNLLRII